MGNAITRKNGSGEQSVDNHHILSREILDESDDALPQPAYATWIEETDLLTSEAL